jgi:hypothetical protein
VDVAPVSSPIRATFGACCLTNAAIAAGSEANEADFVKQLRLITLDDAKIWDIDGRLEYASYWDEKYEKLNAALAGRRATLLADADIQSFRLMADFAHHVGNILALFADTVQPKTFEDFLRYGFDDPSQYTADRSREAAIKTDIARQRPQQLR